MDTWEPSRAPTHKKLFSAESWLGVGHCAAVDAAAAGSPNGGIVFREKGNSHPDCRLPEIALHLPGQVDCC